MGQTRAERLRWVVSEFAAKDLDALRPEEVTALGYDLRQLLSPGWGVTRKVGPLPADQVRTIQREVVKGLRILTEERRGSEPEEWILPSGEERMRARISPDGTGRSREYAIRSRGDETTVIVRGIVYLILTEGKNLRACRQCGTPLVAVKRQDYCSSACSQRARDQRKREAKQATGT